jgi:hypothetical protein
MSAVHSNTVPPLDKETMHGTVEYPLVSIMYPSSTFTSRRSVAKFWPEIMKEVVVGEYKSSAGFTLGAVWENKKQNKVALSMLERPN